MTPRPILFYVFVTCLTTTACAAVPPARIEVLSRGANISTMFEGEIDLYGDLLAIAADGFKHVRVFVMLDALSDADYLRRLDRIVAETSQLKLGLVLCMTSKAYQWQDGNRDVEPFWLSGWKTVASRYRGSSPSYLFLELANEPLLTDARRWLTAQEDLRQTVRAILPRHTILLTGSPYSTVWSLPDLEPQDDDVIYSFHLYQPMIVTHQGADWLPSLRPFVGLAYPPNAANIARLTNAATADALADYKHDGQLLIQREIDHAVTWRAHHKDPVLCDEFGIYNKASPTTRAAWLEEARNRLEVNKIGWTVWEYKGGFGVSPLLEHDLLTRALGLDR